MEKCLSKHFLERTNARLCCMLLKIDRLLNMLNTIPNMKHIFNSTIVRPLHLLSSKQQWHFFCETNSTIQVIQTLNIPVKSLKSLSQSPALKSIANLWSEVKKVAYVVKRTSNDEPWVLVQDQQSKHFRQKNLVDSFTSVLNFECF